MQLMMNDEMEIDMNEINDLFDDGTVLPLQSQPPPKELFQRVDELRGSGCCQDIAWSKFGCIASIISSGRGVELRNLRCHPFDGSWDISEPEMINEIYPKADVIFQHLCWSTNGTDLAVIDKTGRVTILTVGNYLNRVSFQKSILAESPEDLNAVVGTYWINVMPIQPHAPPVTCAAIKVDDGYRFDVSQSISFGPFYPAPQKSALVCITTNGVLRLVWQQTDNTWHETTSEIESVVSSNDLITHASICADRNQSLLVAFATISKQLRTARVSIRWNNKVMEKTSVNPSISMVHLATGNWMDGTLEDASDTFHIQSSMTKLSHLEFFPPYAGSRTSEGALPTILTVRSYLPLSPTHFNQEVHSIIDRWELRDSTQSIHPAFEQLGTRRRVGGSKPGNSITLRKLGGIMVNKVVLRVQPGNLGGILCFIYSDGSVEYRERVTLAEIFPESDFDRITHMSQAGFSYTDDEPCLQVALSPSTCSFVQIGSDGKLKWKPLSHHTERLEIPVDEEQHAAMVAAFAMCSSASVMTQVSYEDVLAIAHRHTKKPGLPYEIVKGMATALKLPVDFAGEKSHDRLIRNSTVHACLSTHSSLGYNGDFQPRKHGAKIAWIGMQIRNCVVLVTVAASTKTASPDNAQKRAAALEDSDTIRMLSGSVKWCLDFMSWLVDSLLYPKDPSIFKPLLMETSFDLDELNRRLHESNNVALHILLSSATRGFLDCICRRLSLLDHTTLTGMSIAAKSQAALSSTNQPQSQISNNLRAAYAAMATLISGSVVPFRAFDTFQTNITTSVKDAYATAGLPFPTQSQPQQGTNTPLDINLERNVIEQTIVLGGPLSPALVPALRHIFKTLLPELRSKIDTSKLFFHDFSLLALDPPPSSPSSADSIYLSRPSTEQALGNLSILGISHESGKPSAAVNEKVSHAIDVFQRVPVTLGQEPDLGELKIAIQALTVRLDKAKAIHGDEVSSGTSALGEIPARHAHGGGGVIAGAGTANGAIPNSSAVAAATAVLQTLQRKARESKKWRRCIRCAAVMEDIQVGKSVSSMLVVQQRRCFCNGHWNLLMGKKVVM